MPSKSCFKVTLLCLKAQKKGSLEGARRADGCKIWDKKQNGTTLFQAQATKEEILSEIDVADPRKRQLKSFGQNVKCPELELREPSQFHKNVGKLRVLAPYLLLQTFRRTQRMERKCCWNVRKFRTQKLWKQLKNPGSYSYPTLELWRKGSFLQIVLGVFLAKEQADMAEKGLFGSIFVYIAKKRKI